MPSPKTSAPPAPAAVPLYAMPPVSVGQPVLHRQRPGAEPCAAIVTRVATTAINVTVFPPESRGGIPKDGVLHATDPRVRTIRDLDGGTWEYTAETLILRSIFESLGLGGDGRDAS